MGKKIGLFWLKEDFRLKKNLALINATKKHDQVVAFYLYKSKKLDNQEAQKWWINKSLKEFKNKLINYNINLEVIKIDSYKLFFDKLFLKKNFSFYWNKTYEPDYINFDKYLSKNFKKNNIRFNIFSMCINRLVVALVRIALTTHTFSGYCSTTELQGLKSKSNPTLS